MSNKWISVKEKPSFNKNVLGYSKQGKIVFTCVMNGDEFDTYNLDDPNDKFTHWMPLPTHPLEERQISKEEALIEKIKFATAGMCHNDLAANRCAKEATEIAVQHLTEKVKSLHNKYDHGEVNNIYNLAIFDVLELLK